MTGQTAKTRVRRKTTKNTSEIQVEQTTLSEQPEQNSSFLFLTNRYNLLDILSSGWIKPAARYTKYYSDLGESCPEWIPLLVHAPSSQLVEDASSHEPGSFPVLLEIDLCDVSGHMQVIREDYQTEQSELPLLGGAVAILIAGVLPASLVRAVHFRSEVELEEHTARKYENIRGNFISLHVSPDRFTGSLIENVRLMEALVSADLTVLPLPPALFPSAIALGGALLTLGGLINLDRTAPMAALVPIIEALQTPTTLTKALATLKLSSGTARWLALLPTVLLEEPGLLASTGGEQSSLLIPAIDSNLSGDDQADFFLFTSTVKTLLHTSFEEYYNEDVLVRIRADFELQLASSPLDESDSLLQHYQETLGDIQAVLRNRIDLAEFPATRFPLATALLFFLLRSEPSRTFSWITERRRPTADVLAVAITFSGLLYGRATIPAEYRPPLALEQYVDNLVARKLNATVRGIVVPFALGNVCLEEADTPETHLEFLTVDNHILVHREVRRSQRNSATQPLHLESHDASLQRLLSSDLKNPSERNAALYLCRAVSWGDCVSTVIPLEGKRFILSANDPQKPVLRISGFLDIRPEINITIDKFRERLTPEFWSTLPDHIHRDIEERLIGGDQTSSGSVVSHKAADSSPVARTISKRQPERRNSISE